MEISTRGGKTEKIINAPPALRCDLRGGGGEVGVGYILNCKDLIQNFLNFRRNSIITAVR